MTLGLNFCYGQRTNLPDELFGFRLGQYKSVIINELGQPNSTQELEDSTFVEFYYVSRDSSSYVGFQYLATQGNPIYAIQLSGKKVDRLFYGINLGDSDKKLESQFGKPEKILTQDFNERPAITWMYEKLNISILLIDNKIESLRIWDNYEQKDYNHPTIEDLLAIIKTRNKSKIADILSPGLEIYYCDKVITWKNSFYKDIYLERSSVMDFIINDDYGLVTLVRKKDLVNDLNLRVVTGTGTFPVYKFPNDNLISELVLKYEQGHYKIWEIKYRCEN
ncbi:MAG: hypothetical protein J0L66_14340 [Cytophagales bacterium]|nr:hypothetical protein [Cytophagales bacterium]